jgi:3-phosphoshikimate 1-carboxyvinyltransferase
MAAACTPLSGSISVPGDKSIGHRALMIGAIARGLTTVRGLSDAQDNSATARILRQLGVTLESDDTTTVIHGCGLSGFRAPTEALDCGNSGTTMRLMLGLLAGQPFEVTFVGDHSLSKRPMERVLTPLRAMGVEVLEARDGSFAPLTIRGGTALNALRYQSPIASAQVKSAILLAGLYTDGKVEVVEPHPSRDHTERMLAHMGSPPQGCELHVPGDLSSAAFLMGAALLVPKSRVNITHVGVNPTRTGFLDALELMGAQVTYSNRRVRNGEPSADLEIQWARLKSFSTNPDLAVRAIDELPLLAVLASRADGTSHLRHAQELRVKESDRIAKTVELLRSFGVPVDEHHDGLTVHGSSHRPLIPGRIDASGDHRIAMCASLLALIAPKGTVIHGLEAISSSFPSFFTSLEELGVDQDFSAGLRQSRK